MQRALLLDDEEIERTILETILAEADFVVCASSTSTTPSASDGYGAFDIAILDLSLSGENQSQFLELCKAFAGSAILVMTDNEIIEHALRINAITIAVDYIKKPFSKEEFLAAVDRTIQHARVLRENHALKEQQPSGFPIDHKR
jgi:DNA-binding NtrC family response regulator